VNELYNIEVFTKNEYSDFIELELIGTYAKKYEQDYFIKPVFKEEKYYELVPLDYNAKNFNINSLFSPRQLLNKDASKQVSLKDFLCSQSLGDNIKKVERTRSVISGVSPTTEMPYQQITIKANPKYPNLDAGIAIILPFLSRTKALLFYAINKISTTGWDGEQIQSLLDWKVSEIGLKDNDDIKRLIEQVYSEMWKITLQPLKKHYGLIDEEFKEIPKANL